MLRNARRGGCLAWGLIIVGVISMIAIAVGLYFFGYFGPPLPETDDPAEWRQLGADAWGTDQPGDWEPVREVFRLLDEAETAVGGAPLEREGAVPQRMVVYHDTDRRLETEPELGERAGPAIEAMRANGLFDKLEALPAAHPVFDGWDQPGAVSMLDVQLKEVRDARQLMRALAWRFDHALATDNPEDAVAAARQLAILSEVIGRQPTMISRLVGNAGRSLLATMVLDPINRGELDDATLAALAPVFERAEYDGLAETLRGEMIAARSAVRATMPGGPLVFTNPAAQYAPIERTLEAAATAVETEPPVKALATISDAESRIHAGRNPRNLMAGMLLPAVTRGVVSDYAAVTEIRGTRVAIALELHRLREGRFPTDLAGLATDLPNDPFANAPFRYRPGDDPALPASEQGCILYSVGLDQQDNNAIVKLRDDGRRQSPFHRDGAGSDAIILGPDSFALIED